MRSSRRHQHQPPRACSRLPGRPLVEGATAILRFEGGRAELRTADGALAVSLQRDAAH